MNNKYDAQKKQGLLTDISQLDRDVTQTDMEYAEKVLQQFGRTPSALSAVSALVECLKALHKGTSYDEYLRAQGWVNLGKPPENG